MIPCGTELFSELSFSAPREGKSPEVKENPSFFVGACTYELTVRLLQVIKSEVREH